MKLTQGTLKQLIKEELGSILSEMRLEHRFINEPQLPKGMPEIYAEKIKILLDTGPEGHEQVLMILSNFTSDEEAEEYVYQKLVNGFFEKNSDEYKIEKDRKGFHLYLINSTLSPAVDKPIPAKTLPFNIPSKEMYEEVMDLERMKGFYSSFEM